MKSALVTGASDGLGKEFAKSLAAKGYHTVLVSRNDKKLASLKDEIVASGGKADIIITDLSQRDAPEMIMKQLDESGVIIHTLINNAGLGDHGDFISSDVQMQQDIIEVNILALTKLTRLLLVHMNQLNGGLVINVGSTAGFQPGPFMSVFFASKSYVLSFSEALRNELKGSGIQVCCLCPGPINTPFLKNSNMQASNVIRSIKPMSPERVVEEAWKGVLKNRSIIIPGFINKTFSYVHRFLPRNLVTHLSRNIVEDI